MPTTNFIGRVTPIAADWLNEVDAHVFEKYHTVDVTSYGAVADGVTDSSAAFNAAWSAIRDTGGILVVPPGSYYLNGQWLLDVNLSLPYNYKVLGYGAQLLAGAAVTGHAIRVYKGYNNFGVTIEGLHFNHRGNTTVGGCIQTQGSANLRIIKCSVEHHNTKVGYSGIEVGPYTAGVGDTNSFWTLIDGFTTRQRSGSDGTDAAMGIRLKGVANATKIMNCSFGNVVDAIRFDTDGVAPGLANGVRILHNDFEGGTNAITINTALPCDSMPTGLRVAFNRAESLTSFVNITGAAVTEPGYPMTIKDNYLTVGSVTNYLVNPNNQWYSSDESSYFGVTTGGKNIIGGPTNYEIVAEGTGKNVVIRNLSGSSAWTGGHLVIGGYHFWVDGSAKFRICAGAPASDTDGQIIGTQT